MNRESVFLIYCMERYRYFKGLSGAEVARLFEQHQVYAYVTRHFEALHTQGRPLHSPGYRRLYQLTAA